MDTEQQSKSEQAEGNCSHPPHPLTTTEAQAPQSSQNEPFVLGIDGGGTKTACVIVDKNQSVVAQVRVGSCNRNSVGDEKARENLAEGIANVLRAANCDSSAIAAACLGMAGIDRPAERGLVSGWMETLLPNVPTTIYNDALIAFASGTGGDLCGVAVISGTGMIVYGINHNGQTQRAGGWGPLFGDKGSAYAIGAAALSAIAHATDSLGPQTVLDGALRDYLDLSTSQALIPWAYSDLSWARIADLAAVVTECAQQKDEVASRIIAEAAIDLAAAVEVVVRGLDMLNEPTPIVLSGGNLQPGLFSSLVHQHLNSLIPQAQLTRPSVNPAVGAAILARQSLHKV